MKKNPPWPKPLLHLVFLGVMPVVVHTAMTFFFGLESENSGSMLFMALFASVVTGAFLYKAKYDPLLAALGSGWPTVLAAWKRWHWALDMPSPAGSAQNIARSFGFTDPPAAAALAVLTSAGGLAGWLIMRFDSWYESKTGHSFFDQGE